MCGEERRAERRREYKTRRYETKSEKKVRAIPPNPNPNPKKGKRYDDVDDDANS